MVVDSPGASTPAMGEIVIQEGQIVDSSEVDGINFQLARDTPVFVIVIFMSGERSETFC